MDKPKTVYSKEYYRERNKRLYATDPNYQRSQIDRSRKRYIRKTKDCGGCGYRTRNQDALCDVCLSKLSK